MFKKLTNVEQIIPWPAEKNDRIIMTGNLKTKLWKEIVDFLLKCITI